MRTIITYRTRMAKFKENFRNGSENIPCPLCQIHFDKQSMAFQCPMIKDNVELKGNYEDVFKEDIPKELVITLTQISRFREKFMEERGLA